MRRQEVGGLAAVGLVGIAAAALGWVRCPLAALYHIPCPGCGMTRALLLMASGRVEASLRMNALAVPALAAGVALAAAAVQGARRSGPEKPAPPSRLARVAIAGSVVVYAAALALWGLRWFGLFGGPVPV